MYYGNHLGYFSWFGMIVFFAISIWIIAWFVNKQSNVECEEKTPYQKAKEQYIYRYITKKQLKEIKKTLSEIDY